MAVDVVISLLGTFLMKYFKGWYFLMKWLKSVYRFYYLKWITIVRWARIWIFYLNIWENGNDKKGKFNFNSSVLRFICFWCFKTFNVIISDDFVNVKLCIRIVLVNQLFYILIITFKIIHLFHCLRSKIVYSFPGIYLADFYGTFYIYTLLPMLA